ncbi:hypothetical protein JS562_47085, partial [Agrobacterium sp. S2]|nr:hypothetical protein [Agrobacterium sp. S2]
AQRRIFTTPRQFIDGAFGLISDFSFGTMPADGERLSPVCVRCVRYPAVSIRAQAATVEIRTAMGRQR